MNDSIRTGFSVFYFVCLELDPCPIDNLISEYSSKENLGHRATEHLVKAHLGTSVYNRDHTSGSMPTCGDIVLGGLSMLEGGLLAIYIYKGVM